MLRQSGLGSFPSKRITQRKTRHDLHHASPSSIFDLRLSRLSRERSLKRWLPRSRKGCTRTPQRVALRMTMRVIQRMPIRMAGPYMTVAVAIPRRGLRKPRRITDRAEIRWQRSNVIAYRLQPLQYRLPLFPIQLPQERPQSLDERILQQRFAVGFRNKEPVQADVERLGDLLQRAEARRHLA